MTDTITRKVRFQIEGDTFPLVLKNIMFGLDQIDLDTQGTNPYAENIALWLSAAKIDGQWVLAGAEDDKEAWTRAKLESLDYVKRIKSHKGVSYQFDLVCEKAKKVLPSTPFEYSGNCGSYADPGGFYEDFEEMIDAAIKECIQGKSADTGWLSFKKSEVSIRITITGRKAHIEASAYTSLDEPRELLDSLCCAAWNRDLSEMEESPEFKSLQDVCGFETMDEVTDHLIDFIYDGSLQESTYDTQNMRLNGPYSKALRKRLLDRAGRLAQRCIWKADRDFNELAASLKNVVQDEDDVNQAA